MPADHRMILDDERMQSAICMRQKAISADLSLPVPPRAEIPDPWARLTLLEAQSDAMPRATIHFDATVLTRIRRRAAGEHKRRGMPTAVFLTQQSVIRHSCYAMLLSALIVS